MFMNLHYELATIELSRIQREAVTFEGKMTKKDFLAAYRDECMKSAWASDHAKLERYMSSVENTLKGANTWICDGPGVRAAWTLIGGQGVVSLKKLRALT